MKKFLSFLLFILLGGVAVQANNLESLTVCEGSDLSGTLPIYGFWTDAEGTMGQMIYPEEMLTDMLGGEITEIKFYTAAYYYNMNGKNLRGDENNYINFDSSIIQLSLKTVYENGFSEVVAYTDATPVATTSPILGNMYLTFVLDESFIYEGGNLLVEAKVIEPGNWGGTNFCGQSFDFNTSYYAYDASDYGYQEFVTDFLPMVTFTYDIGTPHEPTDRTMAPVFTGYTIDGVQGYGVIIEPEEPSTIYYRILFPDETWSEWMEYTDELFFTEPDTYRIEAYAIAPDKLPSIVVAYEFTVLPELEQTMAPVFTGYVIDGVQGYGVIIEPEEPSTIYYRILFPDETWSEWMEYTDELFFTEPGTYRIYAYAVAPDKEPSIEVAYEFEVYTLQPTERTMAPVFTGYAIDGVQGYGVIIEPEEPSTIYYRILFPDETWSEWMEYTDKLFFTEPGTYRIYAYAVAPNKEPSIEVAYEFTVIRLGDVNGDNSITISDVTALITLLLEGGYSSAADLNHDGRVSITDVTMLINMLLSQGGQ